MIRESFIDKFILPRGKEFNKSLSFYKANQLNDLNI